MEMCSGDHFERDVLHALAFQLSCFFQILFSKLSFRKYARGNTRFLFKTKHNVVLSDTIYIQTPKVVDLNHDVYAVKAWGARRELDVT